jgi:hypothetical protein
MLNNHCILCGTNQISIKMSPRIQVSNKNMQMHQVLGPINYYSNVEKNYIFIVSINIEIN